MIIRINTITGIIEIEKGEEVKTIPEIQHPIQYNEYNIKRKYYKKTDKEYHKKPSKPLCKIPKTTLKTSQLYKTVRQEPLLDQDYLFTDFF